MYPSFQADTGVAGGASLPGFRRTTVLVIDHQPQALQAAREMLAGIHEVLTATSGADGIAACQRLRPDLVLLDLDLPDMAGLAVAQHLQRDSATRDIPIIFLVADSAGHEACLDAGAVDFVAKPLHALALQRRVQVHLTIRRQAEELRRLACLDGLDLAHLLRHAHALLQARPAGVRGLLA
ncbi:two-component system response regulator [Oxalobacteraceae bacterium A2-2]